MLGRMRPMYDVQFSSKFSRFLSVDRRLHEALSRVTTQVTPSLALIWRQLGFDMEAARRRLGKVEHFESCDLMRALSSAVRRGFWTLSCLSPHYVLQ